jgi:Domain of unknown function (DUF4365)
MQPFDHRKRRTRQHVIADLSVNHVEGFILDAGHAVQRMGSDYGYDVVVITFDDQGYVEPGLIYLQLKASESLSRSGTSYAFDLDIRDYNLWKMEQFPVILILFDALKRGAYWLHVQDYFATNQFRQPKKGAKTVRVLIGPRQRVDLKAVAKWRGLKLTVATRLS